MNRQPRELMTLLSLNSQNVEMEQDRKGPSFLENSKRGDARECLIWFKVIWLNLQANLTGFSWPSNSREPTSGLRFQAHRCQLNPAGFEQLWPKVQPWKENQSVRSVKTDKVSYVSVTVKCHSLSKVGFFYFPPRSTRTSFPASDLTTPFLYPTLDSHSIWNLPGICRI